MCRVALECVGFINSLSPEMQDQVQEEGEGVCSCAGRELAVLYQ